MLNLMRGFRKMIVDWHGAPGSPGAMERIVRIDERVGRLEERFNDPFVEMFRKLHANGSKFE